MVPPGRVGNRLIVRVADRQTALILDGGPQDSEAIVETARVVRGGPTRLMVFVVPVMVADWAHLEVGEDPNGLRSLIRSEQERTITRMLEAAGVDGDFRMRWLRSRWRVGESTESLQDCDGLIVSTSSALVRRRMARLARQAGISCRFVR